MMSRSIGKIIPFICLNENCSELNVVKEIFTWSNEVPPVCNRCGKKLDIKENKIHPAPPVLKFASLSAGEKRSMLKRRSIENAKKNEEKRKWMYDNDIN